MIISHQHKFIFIKTRKTAGSSIEIALSSICGSNDIITPLNEVKDEKHRISLGFKSAQNYQFPLYKYTIGDVYRRLLYGYVKEFRNHNPAVLVKKLMRNERYDSYYSFAVERNPWDKVLSHYWYLGGDTEFGSINNYLDSRAVEVIKDFKNYTDSRGELIVSNIYKYEELSDMFEDLTNKLSLKNRLVLPTYKAKSTQRIDKRHYNEVLSVDEAEKIRLIFHREINLLNYSFQDIEMKNH
ncbi:hypothetical protein [Sediminitomix flava]|uniref:Sulfotransferase family protein n=1 Tax=Sediminitomix flava TaxID=379075 RepID=A0A315ZEP3_SEDFL|nr:hypothetical protein [Sediminitomix flava]PWJ43298.1 hypothetical protein BC781_102847 [Sediminitomix flava]